MVKKDITIDTLARMTQEQFSKIDERFDSVDSTLTELKEGQRKLEAGQQRIIEVLLEIPSKKAIERLESKVQTYDVRLTSVEKRVNSK